MRNTTSHTSGTRSVSYLSAAQPTAPARKQLPPGALPMEGYVRQAQLVPNVIPISPATLWRWVKAGKFPAPVKLGPMITAWAVADVRNWLESQQSAA